MGVMSEICKNRYLDNMLKEDEEYKFKVWATLMISEKEAWAYASIGALGAIGSGMAGAMGALSNQYCYIGATENNINIVILRTFEVDTIESKLTIPIEDIEKIKIKKSIIPGRIVAYVKLKSNKIKKEENKLKISFMNNAIGTDIANQKEGVLAFKEFAKKFGEKS